MTDLDVIQILVNGECCATALLHYSQRDFQEQKGSLQEKIEFAGRRGMFSPKFHCELNFIERFWCNYSQTLHMFARIVCTLLMVFVRQFQLPSSQYPQLVSTAFIECADAYIHGYRYVHMVRRNLLIMPIKVIVRWIDPGRLGGMYKLQVFYCI
jgi:hypothetical protein